MNFGRRQQNKLGNLNSFYSIYFRFPETPLLQNYNSFEGHVTIAQCGKNTFIFSALFTPLYLLQN